VHWYHAPTALKAMIDRLVCADGGNPDTSSTHVKTVAEAKALELGGWPYPRHLAGRYFDVVVHGDAAGAETLRCSLSDWLTDMRLISAGRFAEADGYVGYMEPYAASHQAVWSPGCGALRYRLRGCRDEQMPVATVEHKNAIGLCWDTDCGQRAAARVQVDQTRLRG